MGSDDRYAPVGRPFGWGVSPTSAPGALGHGFLGSDIERPPRMKVLLGIGGSEDSLDALDRTVRRAREAGDDVTVAVVENPESDRDPEEVMAAVRQTLEDGDLNADVRRVTGDPGSSIVDIAEREDFDEIVLGGGTQSPMGKIRLGHIAEFVLLNSHVTVTLVR